MNPITRNGKTGKWLSLVLLATGLALASLSASAQSVTRVEETHPSVTFSGTWRTIAHPTASGGTIAVTNEAGAKAEIRFNGTGIAWISHMCRCGSYAVVYIDGMYRGYQYTYHATTVAQQDVFWIDGLPQGDHVLTLEASGSRTTGSTDAYIGVDAFDIGNPIYSTTPTLRITSPAENALVTGVVTVNVEASDNAGLGELSVYYEDGQTGTNKLLFRDSTPPYALTVDTSRIQHGNKDTLWATVQDHAGRTGYSNRVPITIAHGGYTDFTKPFVEMTAPANNSLVTGMVTLAAEGYDNVGIAKVQFITSNNIVVGEDTTAPYSVTRDTSNIPSGSTYYIRARAYDAAGNNFTSANAVALTVQHEDPVRPTVSLTAPASGATVSGTVPLAADATDNVGVSDVQFWSGYTQAGWDSRAPYSGLFDTLTLRDGTTTFTAKAIDANRNEATSALVSVNVDNRVQPGMTRVDDAATALVYAGAWETYTTVETPFANTPRFHWGSGHLSRQVGATVTFAFEGVRVRLLAARCYSCGNPTIAIDGGAPHQINLGNDYLLSEGFSSVVWESPLLASGPHTVQLTVQTNAYGGSDVLIDGFEVLKVNDTAAPTVALTAPVGGDVLSGAAVFEATASDDTGVAKVLFYAESWLIGEDTTAPYSITWDTRSQPFTVLYLKAVAYDSVGRRAESSTVRVSVNN